MSKPTRTHKYIALAAGLVSILLGACSKDDQAPAPVMAESRFLLNMAELPAGASVSAEELVRDMRLFAFQKTASAPFSHEVYALTRSGNTLNGLIRTGNWELVMLSPLHAAATAPGVGVSAASQKMYTYTPTVTDGRSSPAEEIFYNRITNLPPIEADGEYALQTGMARNVAMVKLFFEKAAGIDNASAAHTVTLHGVPSTLSWTGGLYPDKTHPDLLAAPLEGVFSFSEIPGETGFSQSDEVAFIIPAHRGSDFWLPDGVTPNPNPTDTTTQKISVSVNLTYADGSTFTASNKEIPIVPRCNGITEVKLKINKTDVEVTAGVKPWDQQAVNGDLGVPFLNLSTTEVALIPGNAFRIYFWTNQRTNISVEPQGRSTDPRTGDPFVVSDFFDDLTNGPDNPNFHFDSGTGSGYFDVNNLRTIPGVTRYYLYFNANGIRRAIAINL